MVTVQMASLRRSVCCCQPEKANSACIHDIRDDNFKIRVFIPNKTKALGSEVSIATGTT